MPVTARQNLGPAWWWPEGEDPEDENSTSFELTPFNQVDYFHFMTLGKAKVISERQLGFSPNREGMAFLLKKCVTNWRNFLDANGTPVEYSESAKETIPVEVLQEIFVEVSERSAVNEALKKS